MTSSRTPLVALGTVGVVMVANSLLFGTQTFFNTRPFSEIAGTAPHLSYQLILLVSVGALNLLLRSLRDLRGPSGARIPAAVLGFAVVATFADGGTRFMEAFVVPYLADHAPALLDESPASALMYAMITAWITFSLALVAIAVTAFRARVFSRPACVLLALGGVSIPLVGPLSGVVIGSALAWCAAARLRSASATVPVSAEPALR